MRRGAPSGVGGVSFLLMFAFFPWPAPPIAPDLPAWTYLDDLQTRSDPIDLVFVGADLAGVASVLRGAGWVDVGSILGVPCQWNEYVLHGGAWRQQDLGLVKDETTYCAVSGTRFHVRLWDLGGVVLGAAHIDHAHGFSHIVHDFEAAEREATRAFLGFGGTAWRVCEEGFWLSNWVFRLHDGRAVTNNGVATVIVGGARWCPSPFLT